MVQVIGQGRVQPKSTSQQFGEAFSRLAQGGSAHMAEQNQREMQSKLVQQREQQENDQLKQLTGIDLTGINDPKIRQEAFKQAMQLVNAPQMQKSKYDARLGALQQSPIGKYLQGGQSQQENTSRGQVNQQGEVEVGNVNVPSMIPEEAIFNAEAVGEHGLAQQFREHNKQILDQEKHRERSEQKDRELKIREKSLSPENKAEIAMSQAQAKADIDYNKELQSSSRQHEIKTNTLNKLEKLNEKGVTGKPYEKILEKFGLVNLTSEGRREFAADVKNLITDIRSILGGQFSNFEFQTILNAYPSADFSQDANRAIINNLKEFQDIRNQEHKIANQIKKENGGKIPADFQAKVNEKLHEYTQEKLPEIRENTRKVMNEEYGIQPGHILMFDDKGEPLQVPESEIDYYESLGAMIP